MADNKTIQKIFSLSDFRKKQLVGEIVERTRETYREYGYFGGGSVPGAYYSTVDRVDYSNDTTTASVRSSLSAQRSALAATGNSNFGYYIGGSNPAIRSNVDRIDYSNDTSTTRVANNFVYTQAATGNSNFGYIGGGANTTPSISNVDRINYSNDLQSTLRVGSLSLSRFRLSATGNSNFGYFIGGHIVSTIDRINYLNDSIIASVRSPLSLTRSTTASTGNQNFGYVGGSYHSPSAVTYSYVDRINYSNDLVTPLQRTFLTANKGASSASGNSNFGYFGGGFNPSPSTFSTVDRIDYSNDTATASIRGPLSLTRGSLASTSSASFGGSSNSSFASNFTFPTVPNAGYFGGGFDGTNVFASIDKVDYANDTATGSVRSALSSARYALAATGNGSFGYYAGGRPAPASPDFSTIDRIEYASDTQNAVVRSTLNNAVRLLAAAGNSNFGYFGGGFPARNGVDRLNYSSDTTATSPRQGLPLATYSLAATGNSNFGYFAGGLTASPTTNRSEIYRVNYSNDSTIPQNRGPLSEAKRELSATGNSNFGYYSAAQNPGLSPSVRTQIERLDYSNDTLITSVRSILSLARFGTGATGNSNFGYFGSGTNGPIYFSTVDRINYSNDTAIASIRGPLSTAKAALAATSPLAYGGAPIYSTNPLPEVFQKQITFNDANTLDLPFKRALGSYGYFGKGIAAARVTTVNRIDYSNDTAIASVRGPLINSSRYQIATGNSNFGYFDSADPFTSAIERIDYSNDGSVAMLRGFVSTNSSGSGATGNSNFGYIGGGGFSPGSNFSTVERIDYSNDNGTTSIRGPLRLARFQLAATGNSNFGYFGSGRILPSGPNISSIDRVNYSNDLSTASVRGPLSLAGYSLAATGNYNFGYFGGGIPAISTVDRIDYANDTQTTSVRGPLSSGRGYLAATGTSNFGYFGGGFPGPLSRVDRIDYSNDTSTASVRGPLSIGLYGSSATTNARSS